MKVRYHVLVSAAVAPVAWKASHSVAVVLGWVAGGVLVDLDHLVDYVLHYGWRVSPERLFRASYQGEYERAYLPLHAWEVWLASAAVGLVSGVPWLMGVAAGWGLHLLLDQLFNRPHALAYSLVYRWARGFRYAHLFPHQAQRRYSGGASGEDPASGRVESEGTGEKPASSRAARMR